MSRTWHQRLPRRGPLRPERSREADARQPRQFAAPASLAGTTAAARGRRAARRPSRSDRQIAAGLGVDHKTVGAARDRLGGTGEIPQLEKTTGTDGKARPVNRQHKRRLNSGIGKTTPSRDKKAGPSPMLDPRAWSLSTPQAREAFVREVGPRDIETVIKAIRLNDQLPRLPKKVAQSAQKTAN
jgi:hypothetical protein